MDTHSDYSSDDENSSKKPKYVTTIKGTGKKWKDSVVDKLIDLLEEKPCIWDIFQSRVIQKEISEK